MTFINIDDFSVEIDDDFLSITIDYYWLLAILLIDHYRWMIFFGDFDFYRFPISIDINRRIKLINIDDIDWFPISIFID